MRFIPQGYPKVNDATLGATSLGQNLKAAEAESQAELSPSHKLEQAPHGSGHAACSSKMGSWCPAKLGGAGEHVRGAPGPQHLQLLASKHLFGQRRGADAHGGHREGGGKAGGAIPFLVPVILMGDFGKTLQVLSTHTHTNPKSPPSL